MQVCEKTDLTSDALFEHNPEDSATYKEEFLLLERSAVGAWGWKHFSGFVFTCCH